MVRWFLRKYTCIRKHQICLRWKAREGTWAFQVWWILKEVLEWSFTGWDLEDSQNTVPAPGVNSYEGQILTPRYSLDWRGCVHWGIEGGEQVAAWWQRLGVDKTQIPGMLICLFHILLFFIDAHRLFLTRYYLYRIIPSAYFSDTFHWLKKK